MITIDTDNPDNVGLYSLRVVRAEDEGKFIGYLNEKVMTYE